MSLSVHDPELCHANTPKPGHRNPAFKNTDKPEITDRFWDGFSLFLVLLWVGEVQWRWRTLKVLHFFSAKVGGLNPAASPACRGKSVVDTADLGLRTSVFGLCRLL